MLGNTNYISKITSSKIISSFVLLFIILLVFSNSLSREFVWDDKYMLQKELFTDWKNIGAIFLTADTVNPGDNISYYRPLTYLTFLFDYQVWKLDPFWYTLENVLLHASVVLLFYLLISKLFGDNLLAFISSMLFGLHPAVTEPVNFIVGGRNTMLCAALSLLSLLSIVNSGNGKRRWAVLSVVFYFLALLSKEQAIILPGLLLMVTLLSALKKFKTNKYLLVSFFGVTAIYFGMRYQILGAVTSEYGLKIDYGTLKLMLAALFAYFRIMVFPTGLNIEYVTLPVTLLSFKALIAIGGMGVLIYVALKKNVADILRIAVIWLILSYIPISNIIPIPSAPVADRYIYVPLLGMCLVAGYGMKILYSKKQFPAVIFFTISLLILGTMTHARNYVWNDELSLWNDVVKKSPEKATGYYNLGVIYQDRGELDEAVQQYSLALQKDPAYALAHINLGIIYYSQGSVDKAVKQFRKAIENNPGFSKAHYNLGRVFHSRGNVKEAVEQYEIAIKIIPDYPEAHNNLGAIYKSMGLLDKAIEHFLASVNINPESPNAHNNLGSALMSKGKLDKAIEHFQIAIKLNPGHLQAVNNLRIATTLKTYSIQQQ